MKVRTVIGSIVLVGLSVLVTREVQSQTSAGEPGAKDQPPPAAGQAAGGDSESLIDVWVRHAMPGQEHRLLERLVGEWDMAVKYKMNADAPTVESTGTCTRKRILGGRFVLEEFDAGELGMPFQGLAIYGYDVFEGKYTSVWIDTTSTAITTSLGSCRQQPCETIAFTGRHGDPWSGQKRPSRGATRLIDADKHVLELFEPDQQGREFKVLEVTYTRQAAAKPSQSS